MNHTPNGKIARLPYRIREQISLRLRDGQTGKNIVAWLNTLPEVQQVVTTAYAGRPINEKHLSEWKKRSHRQWLLEQAALSDTDRLLIRSRQLAQAGEGAITDHLATYLAAQYALARTQLGDPTDPQASLKLLRALCHDVVALRRGDQFAQSMNLQRLRQQLRQPKPPLSQQAQEVKPPASSPSPPQTCGGEGRGEEAQSSHLVPGEGVPSIRPETIPFSHSHHLRH